MAMQCALQERRAEFAHAALIRRIACDTVLHRGAAAVHRRWADFTRQGSLGGRIRRWNRRSATSLVCASAGPAASWWPGAIGREVESTWSV